MELNAGSSNAANGDVTSRKRLEPPGDDRGVPAKRLNMGSTGVVQKHFAVGTTASAAVAAAAAAATVATASAAAAAAAVSVSQPIQQQQLQHRPAQPETPTKTFSISAGGVVTPGKGLVLTTQGMLLSSPSKSGTILLSQPGGQRTPPSKVAVIPSKSPAPIAPASSSGVVSSTASNLPTFTLSPPRVVIKNVGGVTALKSLPTSNSFQSVHVADLIAQPKVIVSAPMAQSQTTLTVKTSGTKPITIAGGRVVQSIVPSQRILLPATAGSAIVGMQPQQSGGIVHHQTISIIAPSTGGAAGGLGAAGGQMVAVLPADVVARLQSANASQSTTSIMTTASATLAVKKVDSFIPIASNDPSVGAGGVAARLPFANNAASSAGTGLGAAVTSSAEPAPGRPRKPCNCTKSQCLKLYCDCFANGEFCHGCNCTNCANNLNHEEERQRAIKSCLDRNPQAFHPKIGVQPLAPGISGAIDVTRRHQKGCNCKRSGCLKNYCECYEAKIMCGSMCKCVSCKNFEESPERKTLMHLADAAEVRVQQQTAAKNKLTSQFRELESKACAPSSDRLAYSYVTYDVVEAICNCLLVQCQEAEQAKHKKANVERLVMEEFGHSLMQIIQAANRPKD